MSEVNRKKIERAGFILKSLADGVNPLSGEVVEKESILNDARIVRCFYFVADVLEKVNKGEFAKNTNTEFVITPEQKSRVKLPAYNIGVNEFCRCINEVIDQVKSKNLTGVELNKRLRAKGILSGIKSEKGHTQTVINEESEKYGFSTELKSRDGGEFRMIIMTEKAKQYVLENLEEIMATVDPVDS